MNFNSKIEASRFLNKPHIKFLDSGSCGQCFYDMVSKKVYKIFNDFFDDEYYSDYNAENILKFSNVTNSTYIWPNEVITVGDRVIGYILPYIKGVDLCKVNPLSVNLSKLVDDLDKVYKDNIIISQNGIITYDVMYNILYGRNGINIIDSDEYNFNCFARSYEEILKNNNRNINYAFKVLLVNNYFDDFVKQFSELKEMYEDLDVESTIFILNLQKKLSEFLSFEVNFLNDALKLKNKKRIKEKNIKFKRLLENLKDC